MFKGVRFVRQRRGELLALRQSYYRRRAEIKSQRQGMFGPPLPPTALHQWSMQEPAIAVPNGPDTVSLANLNTSSLRIAFSPLVQFI